MTNLLPACRAPQPGRKNDRLDLSPGRQRRSAAMTVAPFSPPNGSPMPPGETRADGQPRGPEPAWLGGDLQHRLERAARASGMTVAAVCEQWVREGLDRFEAHQAPEDPDGSGRCSLRTGTCTVGPVPLPVQQ